MSVEHHSAFRVVTFNVQNRLGESKPVREARLTGIAGMVLALKPDLLCLQEVLISDYEYLRQKLCMDESFFIPRDDGERLGEGAPVFCRNPDWGITERRHFWLSRTPHQPSVSWRAKHRRLATVVRLESPRLPDGLWLANLHLDHASHLARRESLALVRRQLARWRWDTRQALIVCGDFNLRPMGLATSGFLLNTAKGADDYALADSATGFEKKGVLATYLGWGPFSLFSGRLDYCLHSPQLQCVAYDVRDPVQEGSWLSDHRIVLADFQFRAG